MALLQVRNFPDEMYALLTNLARYEHRSVAQQTIVMLRSALEEQGPRKTQRLKLLDELLAKEPEIEGDYPSPEDLIREDRDR